MDSDISNSPSYSVFKKRILNFISVVVLMFLTSATQKD